MTAPVSTPAAAADSPLRGDYVMGLECLAGLCRAINLLPLEEMAETNEQMQAVGPILEPTAYQHSGGINLQDQRRVIDAALQLQRVCQDINAEALRRRP